MRQVVAFFVACLVSCAAGVPGVPLPGADDVPRLEGLLKQLGKARTRVEIDEKLLADLKKDYEQEVKKSKQDPKLEDLYQAGLARTREWIADYESNVVKSQSAYIDAEASLMPQIKGILREHPSWIREPPIDCLAGMKRFGLLP